MIRPVNYKQGSSQKVIKLEISSCRCLQLECNEENDETEGFSVLYTPLLPLNMFDGTNHAVIFDVNQDKKMFGSHEISLTYRCIIS